jgi:uncharacterized protein (TIGR03437 family)
MQRKLVLLSSTNLRGNHWTAQLGSDQAKVNTISDTSYWFQVPGKAAPGRATVALKSPELPIGYFFDVDVTQTITCLGAFDLQFRVLDSKNPAKVGDTIEVFLTGRQTDPPIPDGVPNPSDRLVPLPPIPLAEPSAFSVSCVGLAPGLVGLQQMNLKVVGVPAGRELSREVYPGCGVPPVVR